MVSILTSLEISVFFRTIEDDETRLVHDETVLIPPFTQYRQLHIILHFHIHLLLLLFHFLPLQGSDKCRNPSLLQDLRTKVVQASRTNLGKIRFNKEVWLSISDFAMDAFHELAHCMSEAARSLDESGN